MKIVNLLIVGLVLFWSSLNYCNAENSNGRSSAEIEALSGQVMLLAIRTNASGQRLLKLDAATKALIKAIQPGGIILYAQNLQSISQVRALIKEIRALCAIPPFIALDEEGGRVSRLKSSPGIKATIIPPARELAKGGVAAVSAAYECIGEDLAALGFTMNFAPVVDLDFNPNEAYLGDRSFGLNGDLVGSMGIAAMHALQKYGVVAVAKHFPGHGRSKADTHTGISTVKVDRQALEQDLKPFRIMINQGLAAMMSSHLIYTALDNRSLPASLSDRIMLDLARKELGFAGLMITDAFEMKGLNTKRNESDTAILAISAGADMIMNPLTPLEVQKRIAKKLNSDPLFVRSMERAINHVLEIKARFGVDKQKYWIETDAEAQAKIQNPLKSKKISLLIDQLKR